MALLKTIRTDTGIDLGYWRVVHVGNDYLSQIMNVSLAGYVDAQHRADYPNTPIQVSRIELMNYDPTADIAGIAARQAEREASLYAARDAAMNAIAANEELSAEDKTTQSDAAQAACDAAQAELATAIAAETAVAEARRQTWPGRAPTLPDLYARIPASDSRFVDARSDA